MKDMMINKKNDEFLQKNIINLKKIISKTINSSQKYKMLDILGPNELNICISTLENIYQQLNAIPLAVGNNNAIPLAVGNNNAEYEKLLNSSISELILVLKNFGTENFNDLLSLIIPEECISKNYLNVNLKDKLDIINIYQ